MSYYRTPQSIKLYNWFKLTGTLILICLFVFLLLRVRGEAATSPVATPTMAATVQTLPASQTPEPTAAVTAPTQSTPEIDEPAPVQAPVLAAPEVSAEGMATFTGTETLVVPAPQQSLTLTTPQSGALIAGNTVTLAGTGTPGAEIEILDQGKVLSTTVVQPDGAWTHACFCDSGTRLLSVQNVGEPESASAAVAVQVAMVPVSLPDDLVCDEDDENIPLGTDHGTVYVVAPCEYIGLIAARVGVELADLLAVNPHVTDPDRIEPGQILNLPPR